MQTLLKYFFFFFMVILILSLAILNYCVRMPGKNYDHGRVILQAEEKQLRERLYQHVFYLSEVIGERHYQQPDSLKLTARYIEQQFQNAGYEPTYQNYSFQGQNFKNVIAIKNGSELDKPAVIIGAHYDTVAFSPGADDNASGVAVLIELARLLQNLPLERTLQFVAFTNEESPFYYNNGMGSRVFVDTLENPNSIHFMISLEMLGYYSINKGSQKYPFPVNFFYPDTGNFIAFVGNFSSAHFLRQSIQAFRTAAKLPSEGLIAPLSLVPDIARSDQIAFWEKGIPAFMLTDTADYRNPHYHFIDDMPEYLDYERMSLLTHGLVNMFMALDKKE